MRVVTSPERITGGGIKGGQVYGETDEMPYNIVRDPVHIRDLHATGREALSSRHHLQIRRLDS